MANPLCASLRDVKKLIENTTSQLRGPAYLDNLKTLLDARKRLRELVKEIDDELDRFSPQDGI